MIETYVERIIVAKSATTILFPPQTDSNNLTVPRIDTASGTTPPTHRHKDSTEADPVLIHAIASAHARIKDLAASRFEQLKHWLHLPRPT